MRRMTVTVLTIVLAASAASGAVADAKDARSEGVMPMQRGAMPGQSAAVGHGGMAGMMDMMMQMHSQMMGDDMMGGMAGPSTMFGGQGQRFGMMSGQGTLPGGFGLQRGMMGAMAEAFDSDQDGRTTADELRSGLSARVSEFDTDRNGGLSLEEFEAFHARMMRDTMVDRFQYFDADGDGTVSEAEMHRPVNRLSMMPQFQAQPGGAPDMSDDMMDGQSGSMMNDN